MLFVHAAAVALNQTEDLQIVTASIRYLVAKNCPCWPLGTAVS